MSKYKDVVILFPVFKQVLSTRPELYTRESPHPRIYIAGEHVMSLAIGESISLEYLLSLVDGHLE